MVCDSDLMVPPARFSTNERSNHAAGCAPVDLVLAGAVSVWGNSQNLSHSGNRLLGIGLGRGEQPPLDIRILLTTQGLVSCALNATPKCSPWHAHCTLGCVPRKGSSKTRQIPGER